jgi:putative thioredoxin
MADSTLGSMIVDVTEDTFEQEVVERSRQLPVVVDFWAAWCGPCRQLTPVLEKAVSEREGKIVLAKVDTDANPRISEAFGIRGIPAVKAFKDGKVVSEFTGAQPPARVEAFFDALVPSEADELIESGSEDDLRRALELEPARTDAAVALARMLADRGDRSEALELLDNRPGFAAEGLQARLRLEEDPDIKAAFERIDAGDTEGGLDALIAKIAEEPDQQRKDELRRAVVGVLDELGVEHPLARESRRKLAAALY